MTKDRSKRRAIIRWTVYLFGKNGEKVSHPDQNSGFFDLILEKSSTEAVRNKYVRSIKCLQVK